MPMYRNAYEPMLGDVVVRTSTEMNSWWHGREVVVTELRLCGEVVSVFDGTTTLNVDTCNMRLRRRADGTVPENAA